MTKTYLLEVGMEEIPARFLLSLSNQLKERMENFLTDQRIDFGQVTAYATPRRLSLIVRGLAEGQASLKEKVKGPALKIAQDDQGQWTKAALGFAKGQQASVEDIFIEDLKGEDYIFIEKENIGLTVAEVLSQTHQVLESMNFPVSMTWHNYTKPYIRPIHWLVSLLDKEVVPLSFYNIEAGQMSYGHRFLGKGVKINHPDEYLEKLESEYVIADFNQRRQVILQQIQTIAQSNQWKVPIDEDLLEEVTAIVEWPHAFTADFEEEYLTVPDVVLITAMRDHQRYFYVLDNETEDLLAHFISVRNGNGDHIDNVIKGNQKVLRARLEDALFFYREDMKHELKDFTDKLSLVKEHYKLDSLAAKQQRVANIVTHLAKAVNEVAEGRVAQQAADIYKFDLVTQVVEEFSELQGTIGQIYALEFGVDKKVAAAIGEQYLPNHSGGELPQTKAGSLLALADKLDTLLNYFNIHLIPTGSNDPYGLRRQAMGVVEILADHDWSLNLSEFIQLLANDMNVENEYLIENVVDFIKARTEQHLDKLGIDHDIVQASLHTHEMNVTRSINFAKALQNMKNEESQNYQAMVEALTRVINLGDNDEIKPHRLDMSLAETPSESSLINLASNHLVIDPNQPLSIFVELTEPITEYFQHNMVNSDKRKIKRNRLATMRLITDFVLKNMDPRLLISKF